MLYNMGPNERGLIEIIAEWETLTFTFGNEQNFLYHQTFGERWVVSIAIYSSFTEFNRALDIIGLIFEYESARAGYLSCWQVYIFIFTYSCLSLSIYIYPIVCPSVRLSVRSSIHPSTHQSIIHPSLVYFKCVVIYRQSNGLQSPRRRRWQVWN